MGLLTIILIAIVLALDSFSVSLACGTAVKNRDGRKFFTIPFSLSLFQAIAPLMGWWVGIALVWYLEPIDHWIAFVLLSFVGSRLIYSAKKEKYKKNIDVLTLPSILFLSLITSIDAFIVGVSFVFVNLNIYVAMVVIGIVTYVFSFAGIVIGRKLEERFHKNARVIGGLVLIMLGVKILIDHIFI